MIDSMSENGSLCFGFHWKATSTGFSSKLNDISFYRDDLERFSDELEKLAKNLLKEASLEAKSEFKILVTRVDRLGHFRVQIKMESRSTQNSSCTVNQLDTSSVLELAKGLRDTIKK